MKTPLAWRNVLHSRMRSFVALSGVSFALVLIFMQLGFRQAAQLSATLVYNNLDFDLMVVSPLYMFLGRPRDFPVATLEKVRSCEGVESVAPVWLGWGEWRNVDSREGWGMLALGIDLAYRPFLDPEVNGQLEKLTVLDAVLVDRLSRPDFGNVGTGISSEIARHRVNVVGRYTMGAGFVAGATFVTSDHTFERIFPGSDMDRASFGLVKLRPGLTPGDLTPQINSMLGPSARAITRQEISDYEQGFWMNIKPIGIMFTTGVLIAFIVGAVILYQVLVSEVQNRIREYATLKALGYSNGYIYSVVFHQAMIFSVLGFVPAVIWALVLYALLRSQALLPVTMEWSRIGFVFALTATMCFSATFLAIRKLRGADPAELFG
jgi:putative ABC transport system permease protein